MADNQVPANHSVTALKRVQEVRAMREQIPNFSFPLSARNRRGLNSAASVPAPFVELTMVTVQNSASLTRGGAANPAEIRDLMSFADSYEPFATELEALAEFVRHSIAAARNKVGRDALTTYALAKRLAAQPETADLAPHVREMKRALGPRGKRPSKAAAAVKSDNPGVVPLIPGKK